VAPADGSDPAETYRAIRRELAEYSAALGEKPEIVALNKIDLVPAEERQSVIARVAAELKQAGDERLLVTSGASQEGIGELLEACWQAVGKGKKEPGWGGAATG
jgi:GTP-binding protein